MTFELKKLSMLVETGARAGVVAALEEHRRAGRSVFVLQGDKVVSLLPGEIPDLIAKIQAGGLKPEFSAPIS